MSDARLMMRACLALCVCVASTAHAQQPAEPSELLEAEARAVFEAGTAAFADSRYDDALGYFQRAYALSNRHELLYNIAITADRLRQDQVALEAFEQFVARVPGHARRRDAEARIEVLRRTIAEPSDPDEPNDPAPVAGASSGPDMLSIGLASGLSAVGLAGVIAAIVGAAGAGGCVTMDGSVCVEERGTNWVAFGVYGGLGLAALAGGVVWLIIAATAGPSAAEASVTLTADGVAWSF
jgi:tetratricopeptide (TPR) repeat protein